jgi:NAD(P)-dependent dehydrogenase (short-subunit alcohol dehydrogenase family)
MSATPAAPCFRVDGQRALVTGASRGIGFAAAAALAQAGAEVTLLARSPADLDAAVGSLREAGHDCAALALDVTDAASVRERIGALPPFQILVNNAGMNRPKELVHLSDEDVDAVLDLNVKAAFQLTRVVVQGLLDAGLPGSIINMSSQMGHVGSPRRTLYCASKHALEGFTRALAWELGRSRIRVNTVCPTFIETDMTAPMFADAAFRTWVVERIALGRLGRPEEIMGAIVFLASGASSLVTGSALMLDGGWTAA